MEEAFLPDPFEDAEALAWIEEQGDDLLTNVIVRSASDAFGHEVVSSFGKKREADGKYWASAKLHYSAILTRISMGELAAPDALAKVLLPVCDLIQRARQTPATRVLEFELRRRMTRGFRWGS